MSRRCEDCGRFCRIYYNVWRNPYSNGIDREVCERCAVALGVGVTVTTGKST